MSLKNTARNASCLFCFLFQLVLSRRNEDVILGGIFSEHYPRISANGTIAGKDGNIVPCGEPNRWATADRLAMQFAVWEINRSEDILPGIWLGVNMKDSCNDLDHAINNTLDYEFIKTRFVNRSFQCATEETETKCCLERGKDAKRVQLVAIIAGGYSHIIKAIVNLVGLFKVPVIGYSSTSPSLNKMDYFLRTVPPDTVSTQVMVDLIHKLRWNIVLLLYVDNEFGHYAADCFRKAIRSVETRICIAYDDKFSKPSRNGEIQSVVEGIKKAEKSHVILFFGTIGDFVYFQKHSEAHFDPNKYVWISSELWSTSDLIGIRATIKNILAIIPGQGYPEARFIDYLRSRADVNTTCSHDEMMCNSRTERNCSFERSKHIPLVLDAVYAVAMAMHNMLGCEVGKSCLGKLESMQQRSLLGYIKNVSFLNTLTNQTVSFDSNGNPQSARYTVVKLEISNTTCNSTVIGNWTCHKNTAACVGPKKILGINASSFRSNCGATCNRGQYKSVEEEYPDCCWSCRKCTGNKYTNTSAQFSCSECPGNQWPDENHTLCADIEHEYLDILSAPGILILAWDCLGVVVILFVCGVFFKYGTSHIVRASSRQLSLLLLLGITMDFALLMALLAEPNDLQCTVVFIATHVANCLVTGTLFLKTNRIHRIFRKSAMTERPRCLGNACQLFIVMILVLIEIILAATVLVFKPENGDVRVTYLMQGDRKKAFLLCNFFGKSFQNDLFHVLIWSYDCGLIFICTYQAYLVRKVPENYNEARYITFTMVNMSMNIIVYVITTSGMEGKNLVLVYCVFQSLTASIALGCMFLPKVYIILFQPEKNVPHNPVKSKLGTFVEENSLKVNTDDSVSSGSSVQPGESESSAVGTASTETRGRPYRKVGAKVKQSVVGESGDNFERASKFEDLRSREQDVSPDTGECLKQSADVVFVNGLTAHSTSA